MRVYIFILAMTAVYPWLDGLDIQLAVLNPYTIRREVATAIGTFEGTNGHSRPLRINMHDHIVQAFRVILDLKQRTRDR